MVQSATRVADPFEATMGPSVSAKPRWLPCLLVAVIYWIIFWPVKAFADSNYFDLPAHLLGPLVACGLFMIAWLAFSRRSWGERSSGLGTFLATGVAANFLVDPTMQVGLVLHALPTLLLLWGVWGFLTRRQLSLGHRRMTLALTMFATVAFFCLLRLDGVSGATDSSFSWRWEPTAEQRFLEIVKTAPPRSEVTIEEKAELVLRSGDWPGFRGPQRDSVVRDVRIETNWSTRPPEVVWQKAIGPGWSSIAVVSDRLFTQEQRGDEECVTSYDAATGAELWCHRSASRHFDPISGTGPRSTPQFANGKIFTQGASGPLLCLDAATGRELWQANVVSDSQAELPKCGFAGSPLVLDGVVVTIPGGTGSASVVTYREVDGAVVWKAGQGVSGYTSAHRAELLEQQQVVALTDQGAMSLDAQSGETLWLHPWPSNGEPPITQPLIVDSSKILIPAGRDLGTRLLEVKLEADNWSVTELWISNEFKPYFNDFVLHEGHAFGFDGNLLCCVDLATGKRLWKKGRYGSGQVLLLAEQALLLVISEKGEIVLLEANPSAHRELAKISALSGKTWNHPALVGDRLFVRNGEQLACIRLPAEMDSQD